MLSQVSGSTIWWTLTR